MSLVLSNLQKKNRRHSAKYTYGEQKRICIFLFIPLVYNVLPTWLRFALVITVCYLLRKCIIRNVKESSRKQIFLALLVYYILVYCPIHDYRKCCLVKRTQNDERQPKTQGENRKRNYICLHCSKSQWATAYGRYRQCCFSLCLKPFRTNAQNINKRHARK